MINFNLYIYFEHYYVIRYGSLEVAHPQDEDRVPPEVPDKFTPKK